jgi:hypothetical protein
LRRMKPESEDTMHGYKARDDHYWRKRERDDGTEQKRRDDNSRMHEKVDDHHHAKHKDDSWRKRERDDRQRPKHESTLTLQRDEGRGTNRGGRMTDDKLVSGARREEPRSSVLSKDFQERTRKNEPLRGQGAEENIIQNKGRSDVHPRENNTERNSRQENRTIIVYLAVLMLAMWVEIGTERAQKRVEVLSLVNKIFIDRTKEDV